MRYYIFILLSVVLFSCSSGISKNKAVIVETSEVITSNSQGKGPSVSVELFRGKSFYYPLMAIWIEDADGNFIQTLFVTRSVATGIFKYGSKEGNRWVKAPKRAPQTLPYWAHKRGVKASDGLFMPEPSNPVPDAYTGPTPVTGFVLNSKADTLLPDSCRCER